AAFLVFFRYVCRHFLASGTGNAANPVSAVRATDVMVNSNLNRDMEIAIFSYSIGYSVNNLIAFTIVIFHISSCISFIFCCDH
ncbi:hypothetical protein L8P31_23965, partial [Enterobacter roggenkampii]|nr:hypothetical protein [Enterobacter roggenkampii]